MRRPIQQDPKAEFEVLHKQLSERWKLAEFERGKAQQLFSDALYLACRQRGIAWPSRDPIGTIRAKHPDIHDPILLQARAGMESREESFKVETARLKRIVCALAELCSVEYQSSPMTIYYSVYEGAYGSQGFGAEAYAKGRALQEKWVIGYVDPYVACAIEHPKGGPVVLKVNLDPLDTAVLKCKADYRGMPMREYIRRIWAHGLNPRVYNPFLPHGLEDKMGIDMMGNDHKTSCFVCRKCGRKWKNTGAPMRGCGVCEFDLAPVNVCCGEDKCT
jgi:hypothetical protein